MISHDTCDHEKTSAARAKCRRQRKGTDGGGESRTGSVSEKKASKADIWMGKAHHNPNRERNRGTTPRDKNRECMNCHVEVIGFAGTDPLTGILMFVGEKCTYLIEKSEDFRAARP